MSGMRLGGLPSEQLTDTQSIFTKMNTACCKQLLTLSNYGFRTVPKSPFIFELKEDGGPVSFSGV